MNTDEAVRAKAAAKSLRWLANMFTCEALGDETDKKCRCIHLYCAAGADNISALTNLIESLQDQLAERNREIRSAELSKRKYQDIISNLQADNEAMRLEWQEMSDELKGTREQIAGQLKEV